MRYLADTNWVIDYMNGVPQVVESDSTNYLPQGIGLSIISLAELYDGVYGAMESTGVLNGDYGRFLDGRQ